MIAKTPRRIYGMIWCFHLAVQLTQQRFLFVRQWASICTVCAVLFALTKFEALWAFRLCLIARSLARLDAAPFVWDSEYWCLLSDVATWPMSDSVEATVAAQWSVLYLAAGVWKCNRGFLDPATSCATIFSAQLFDSPLLAQAAPASIAAFELLIGVAFWLAPATVGVPLCLVFHAAVALTPPPNGVPTFSLVAATRCALIARCSHISWGASVVAAAIACAIAPAQRVSTAAFFAIAMLSRWPGAPHACGRRTSRANVPLVVLALAYSSLPMFGMMDIGAPTMFGGLKVHGGSNHLLLPTGLLQQWFIRSSAFGGGVVRVEHTSSQYLRSLYPGELHLDALTLDVLKRADHVGRQFAPKQRRIVPSTRITLDDVPYTMPFFELKRLLDETPPPFNLTFSVLSPILMGDESWRRQSEPACTLTIGVDDKITILEEVGDIDGTVLRHLHAFRRGRAWAPVWARKCMLFAPYAVLAETSGQSIPCNY